MDTRRSPIVWPLFLTAFACCCQFWPAFADEQAMRPNSPLSPAKTLKHFVIHPDLKVEIAAAEPEIVDPVAVRFDEHLRMWVVEMRDYPNGPSAGASPTSRIKVLEDVDHDGYYETATIFADNLLFATGIQPWKGGVFVTMAGRVAYMKDTDGNGRADLNETWFTGFAEDNPQLRANHPTLAIDNYIYIANGLRGGMIQDVRHPSSPPISVSGRDFRFNPLTGHHEAVSGNGQFGMTFDDYGNRFICSNRNPLMQVILEDRFLARNPRVAIPATIHDVAAAGSTSRIFPLSRAWTTSNLHAGQFTAACGVTIYRGDALPETFYGNGFTCDPTGNLVHRESLQPAGMTFQSTAGRKGIEFLASVDEWFRPVNLETGPDGALYVVDMYRAVIEHPQWVPDELKNRPDERFGENHGRIYRIVSNKTQPQPTASPIATRPVVGMAEELESANIWQRETSHRLLLQRAQDLHSVQALQSLLANSPSPQARTHALWLLNAFQQPAKQKQLQNGKPNEDNTQRASWLRELKQILQVDPPEHPEDALLQFHLLTVLSNTLQAAPEKTRSEYRKDVASFLNSKNGQVRGRAILSLAPLHTSEVPAAVNATLREINDHWTMHALLISSGESAAEIIIHLVEKLLEAPNHFDSQSSPLAGVLTELAAQAGSTKQALPKPHAAAALMRLAEQTDIHLKQTGFLALRGFFGTLLAGQPFATFHTKLSKPDQQRTTTILNSAKALASDSKVTSSLRVAALELLQITLADKALLTQLAISEPSQSVRLAALSSLGQEFSSEAWQKLLDGFPRESPMMRRAILNGILRQPKHTSKLLTYLRKGQIRAFELDRTQVDRLLKHPDPSIQEHASEIFTAAIPADRQKVLQDYGRVLEMDSNPQRGQTLFVKNCASCHRIGNLGTDVAPDISDSRTKLPQQLLTDILQPNRAIDNNYISYTVVTEDGRILTGILTSESSTSITLKQPEGKLETLLRTEIEELRSNGVSLMPVGLEKNLSHQGMADVISFIKNWRYLDGQIPFRAAE